MFVGFISPFTLKILNTVAVFSKTSVAVAGDRLLEKPTVFTIPPIPPILKIGYCIRGIIRKMKSPVITVLNEITLTAEAMIFM